MPRNINITEQHLYLNEYDIAPFVVEMEVVGERVIVTLLGDVSDLREIKQDKKKAVKDGNRKISN